MPVDVLDGVLQPLRCRKGIELGFDHNMTLDDVKTSAKANHRGGLGFFGCGEFVVNSGQLAFDIIK